MLVLPQRRTMNAAVFVVPSRAKASTATMLTTGTSLGSSTVISTAFDRAVAPRLSVASAVITCRPTGTSLHVRTNGGGIGIGTGVGPVRIAPDNSGRRTGSTIQGRFVITP